MEDFVQAVVQECADMLDRLEVALLDFEGTLASGRPDLGLVHAAFRHAHNLKGTLGMIGQDAAAALVHAVESHFDDLRNKRVEPDAGRTGACLDAVEALRRHVAGPMPGDARSTGADELTRLQRRLRAGRAPAPVRVDGLPFPLDAAALGRLERARAAGYPLFRLDKAVSTSLDRATFERLPLFDSIAEAGILIGAAPAFDDLPRDRDEALIQVLFAATVDLDELPFLLFDPYCPVDLDAAPAEPTSPTPRGLPRPATAAAPAPAGEQRILVVEDDFVSRFALGEILSDFGAVDVAVDGGEAIHAFRMRLEQGAPYTLVCLDIMMPGVTGHEAIRGIRALEAERGLRGLDRARIVMTTALSSQDHVFAAFREQADGYLVKPISYDSIVAQLERLGLLAARAA